MKLIYNIFFIGLFSLFLLSEGCKSNKEIKEPVVEEVVVEENPLESLLEGLRPLTHLELNGRNVQIDGKSMPVYNEKGERLEGQTIVDLFRDDNKVFDIYGDEELEPKAVLVRDKTEAEIGGVEVKDEDLPPMETVLEFAPSFISQNMDGDTIDLEDLKGKIVIINFWFIQCKPCIEEMPELNKLVELYKENEDVVFLGITHDSKEKVSAFLEKTSFDYNLIPDAQSIVDDYIVMGFPTNIVIDKLGDIQYQSSGYRHQIDKILGKEITKAMSK